MEKLKSRKLWAAVIGTVTGIAILFGMDGGTVETVAGAVVAVASVVSYIIAEGRIDAASAAKAAEALNTAADALTQTSEQP